MLRVIATHGLLLFLPFIVYGFYLYFRHIDPLKREAWERTPIYWLAVIGLVLAISSFFALAAFTGAEPGSTFVPSRFEDGRLIPGYYE